jgi:hypothetical protein
VIRGSPNSWLGQRPVLSVGFAFSIGLDSLYSAFQGICPGIAIYE